MISHFKKNWDKVALLLVAISIITWLLMGHNTKEKLLNQKNLELEMDTLINRVNQLVQINRTMLEVTATDVEAQLNSQDRPEEIKFLLKRVVDRSDYSYGLYISPDQVINGDDRIDPIRLLEQGRKKYGETVYFGNFFFDGERKTLWIPMFMKLNDQRRASKSVLYTEIDATALVRDINRIHINRGGQGFLVDHNGKITSLSLNASVAGEALTVITKLVEDNQIGQNGFIQEKEHLIAVRAITSTDYKLIYIEPTLDLSTQNTTNYFLIGFVIMLLFAIVVIDMKRYQGYEIKILESKLPEDQKKEKENSSFYEWLQIEAEQVKQLYSTDYSVSILDFKAAHCLRMLNDSEHELLSYASNDFAEWANQHLIYSNSALKLDYYDGNSAVAMSPAMLQAGINIIDRLCSSGLDGTVQIKTDIENQLMVFNCFGEVSKILVENGGSKLKAVSYNIEKDDARITVVGTKIILSLSTKQGHRAALKKTEKANDMYPSLVYFYENETEQNAILKFYLDYLKMPYEVITSLKGVPDNSVVMITETVYFSLTEADNIGVSLPYRFIVCGDLNTDSVMDTVTVNRPYALDKIEYALNRIAQK